MDVSRHNTSTEDLHVQFLLQLTHETLQRCLTGRNLSAREFPATTHVRIRGPLSNENLAAAISEGPGCHMQYGMTEGVLR